MAAVLKQLLERTQCEIFVLDKEGPPPGCTPFQRVIVLIGPQSVVATANSEVNSSEIRTRIE